MSETEVVVAAPATIEPDRAAIEFQLDPCLPTLWFWQTALLVGVLGLLPALITLIVSAWLGGHAVAFISLPFVAVAALLPFWVRRYARRYLQRFRGELLADGLRVARGVWWRSEILVPRSRIQHTDVSQGPIARRFGVAKLAVYTAGTHESEIGIECLPHAVAMSLRDRLLGRDGHDAV